MKRAFAVAHLQMLSLAPPEFVETAHRCGFDGVAMRLAPVTREERPYPLTTDAALLRATKERLSSTGVTCVDVEVVSLAPDVEPESYQRLLEVGALLGARTLTVHLPDPNITRAIDKFGRLCAMARPFGLHASIEFLPWTDVPSLAAAAHICRAVAAENCGVLVDTLHFHRSKSTVAEIEDLPSSWLRVLHISDCPAETPVSREALIHTARRARLLPGEGAVDFPAIVGAMPSDVQLTLEIPNDKRAAELGLEEYSRQALATTRSYFDGLHVESRRNDA